MLLAWTKVLVDEELYDKPYVEAIATGFDDLKAALDGATPAWASQQTGIPEETIVMIAREMVSHKPNVCVSAGRYGTWYGDDTQRARAIATLSALLGSWGRPGGYYLPAMGSLPKYPGVPAYPETKKRSNTTRSSFCSPRQASKRQRSLKTPIRSTDGSPTAPTL